MLSADLHLGPRLRAFTSLKSGLEDGRTGGPRPTDEDRLDLHEAFVDVRWTASPPACRLGRREVAFGSQRLVSVRGGPNVRQTFDGISVLVAARAPGGWRRSSPSRRRPDRGVRRQPGPRADVLGRLCRGPAAAVQAGGHRPLLSRPGPEAARFEQGTASEFRDTVGTRIWRRAAPWDYNFELVYQWGRFGSAPIRAWTVASDTGLTLRGSAWRPRFGLKADVTSGDRDPSRALLQSFNPLFPRGAYFGENQLIGPVNHIDLHPSIDLHPLPA